MLQATLAPLLLLLSIRMLTVQTSSTPFLPSSSGSDSAPCQPDTHQQLLRHLVRTGNASLASDESGYVLSLTWQPGWNSSVWEQLGCLTDVSTLCITASTPLPALPDAWAAPGTFQQLRNLWIAADASASTLPRAWASPGAFPALQILNLSGCQLHGALPTDWGLPGAFQNLGALDLGNNSLSSGLPDAWANGGGMPQLLALNISGNPFSSTLPASWGAGAAFQSLQLLDASLCHLSGTLPEAWSLEGSFPALKTLWLEQNSLSGSLPASYGAATAWQQLQLLNLDRNLLSGALPASWARSNSFPRLRELRLGGQALSGPLPEWWGQGFPGLETLDLEYCALHGTLPAAWGASGSWPALQMLSLDRNRLQGTLPAEWSAAAAFPSLQVLSAWGNALTGTLPAWDGGGFRQLVEIDLRSNSLSGSLLPEWGAGLPRLQRLDVSGNRLEGSLPPEWGAGLPQLQRLDVSGNRLEGPLPPEWAGSGSQAAFPQLSGLFADANRLTGPLPGSWGSTPGAMPSLRFLDINTNEINGPLPDAWGWAGALPQLAGVFAGRNSLSGPIPASWASYDSLPSLDTLDLGNNSLLGQPPAFHNQGLHVLNLANNAFEGDGGSLWASTAPLEIVDVSGTRIAGGLPLLPAFSATLICLNVDNTSLSGIIPLSWLGPDGLLARIVFKGHTLWASSAEAPAWRKEVCVTPDFYFHDAAALLAGNTGVAASSFRSTPTDNNVSHYLDLEKMVPIYADIFEGNVMQEQSVQDICKVIHASKLLGVVWGIFLGVTAACILGYCIAVRSSNQAKPPMRCKWAEPLLAVLKKAVKLFSVLIDARQAWAKVLWAIGKTAANLFTALIYVYDFTKDIIVLAKVWAFHQWYGYTLLGVLLGHYVYRGVVMSVYFTQSSVNETGPGPLWVTCMRRKILLVVVSCPFMVIFTLYMDMCTYLTAILGMQSPYAVDIDSYADMRSLVMAMLQSLPVSIITSIVYLRGNSPFWGEYFTVRNAALILVGSLSSIVLGLCRLLYVAYAKKLAVHRAFGMLFTGQGLHHPIRAVTSWRSCLPTCSPGCLAWWSGRAKAGEGCELASTDKPGEPRQIDPTSNEQEGDMSVKNMPV